MRSIAFKLTGLFILIVSCSRVAAGQSTYSPEHRKFDVAGFVGTSFMSDVHSLTQVLSAGQQTASTEGIHYASGYQAGIRVSENVDDFWAVHLEYNFANQPLRFINLTPALPSLSLSHYVHHLSYDVAFFPMPPTKRFRPHVEAGVGTALFYIPGHSREDARDLGLSLRDSWEFAFNFGGGFKHLLADQVAFTLDVKDQISGIPSYGLPGTAQVIDGQYFPGFARSGLIHNVQFNIGIAYEWDE